MRVPFILAGPGVRPRRIHQAADHFCYATVWIAVWLDVKRLRDVLCSSAGIARPGTQTELPVRPTEGGFPPRAMARHDRFVITPMVYPPEPERLALMTNWGCSII